MNSLLPACFPMFWMVKLTQQKLVGFIDNKTKSQFLIDNIHLMVSMVMSIVVVLMVMLVVMAVMVSSVMVAIMMMVMVVVSVMVSSVSVDMHSWWHVSRGSVNWWWDVAVVATVAGSVSVSVVGHDSGNWKLRLEEGIGKARKFRKPVKKWELAGVFKGNRKYRKRRHVNR